MKFNPNLPFMRVPQRNCKGKLSYSKKDALTARNRRMQDGEKLRVYQCPDCNQWHLTHVNLR